MAPTRYHGFLITLHWLIALALGAMLASGLLLESLPKPWMFTVIQWHKSLGVLVLLAVSLRLLVRLSTHTPPLPQNMKAWEVKAAHAGHAALYILMFTMPLTGWLMVSSSPYGLPTLVFGLFTWPHIPGLAMNSIVNGIAKESHEIIAYLLMATGGVHVAAVIKHAVTDKIHLLPRITFLKSKE